MAIWLEFVRKNKWLIYASAILLVIPALFVNLGLQAFNEDEGTRALVALEMELSGNYITPTLLGEFYYSKPPLYNWVLILFFRLFGEYSEWVERLPSVLSLLGYGYTVFYFVKKVYDKRLAFVAGMSVITCGRILFWESFWGLIDITFSWLIFMMFMVIYFSFKKENHLRLFVLSYLLAAITFLLKGLPSIVFLGITLLTIFIYHKKFKRLFCWQHVLGGAVFLFIVGGYYLAYFSQNPNSVEDVFMWLFMESSKRTPLESGIGKTILHLFEFPFEIWSHFIPWSVFAVFFIRRNSLKIVRQQPFLKYCALVFLFNVLIYWISPKIYPRYLIMFPPLVNVIFIVLYYHHQKNSKRLIRYVDMFLIIISLLISVAPLFYPFISLTRDFPFATAKSLILFVGGGLTAFLFIRLREYRLELLVIIFLLLRMQFNWFIIPTRVPESKYTMSKESSLELVALAKDKKLLVMVEKLPMKHPRHGELIHDQNAFYITRERNEILRVTTQIIDYETLYITQSQCLRYREYEKIHDLTLNHHIDIPVVRFIK